MPGSRSINPQPNQGVRDRIEYSDEQIHGSHMRRIKVVYIGIKVGQEDPQYIPNNIVAKVSSGIIELCGSWQFLPVLVFLVGRFCFCAHGGNLLKPLPVAVGLKMFDLYRLQLRDDLFSPETLLRHCLVLLLKI